MSAFLIGVIGVAVLSGIFGLVELYANRRARTCGGCALASTCEARRQDDTVERAADHRKECYVTSDDPERGAPVT